MSPVAILVLTVVVLVLMAGWLGVVFFVARQPGGGSARPGNEDPARARQARVPVAAARYFRARPVPWLVANIINC